jgi:hypothetical protein
VCTPNPRLSCSYLDLLHPLCLHAAVVLVELTTVEALVITTNGGDFAGERHCAPEVLLPLLLAYWFVKGRAPQILDWPELTGM